MTISIPFFGETDKFRPLLDQWFASYKSAGLATADVVLITDRLTDSVFAASKAHGCGVMPVDVSGFRDLIRPGQPFDLKGAIVCAALLKYEATRPLLVLDADAFVAKDPRPVLAEFCDAPIAMPLDHGALIHFRTTNMDKPYTSVKKQCAGVILFGTPCDRSRLVAGYRRAFEELLAMPVLPWTPPLAHLVEQYAWSICAHRRGGKILPVSMNWAPVHLGVNPDAIVNHHYGHPKWRSLPRPEAIGAM